mgnify:CR=1 FL=1
MRRNERLAAVKKEDAGNFRSAGKYFMNKRLIVAFVLIIATAVVLLFNMRGFSPKMDIDLVITTVNGYKSMIFMSFAVVGVLIGLLMK